MSKVTERQLQGLIERKNKLEALRANYQPHAKQELILKALKKGYRQIFVRAGRQSGKTQECCDVSCVVAGLTDDAVCSIITPTLKQAKKIYWKKRTLQNFPPRDWVKKEANDDFTLFMHNGSYIEVDGSDNIHAHRGDKKDLVVLDEYKDIDPNFYPEVIEPMFMTTGGIAIIIGTPPETPESHFRDLERFAEKDPHWATIHWTSYDSPYTDKDWLDRKREQLKGMGMEDSFKREYLAEYTRGGKNSVFPMFSREFHMKEHGVLVRYFHQHRDRYELYWINDPATSTTFGALLIAYRRETGQILVLDEIYEKDKSKTHTKAVVDAAREKMAPFQPTIEEWQTVYDDAAVWFSNELLHEHKIPSFPAKKQTVQKEDGIALMKALFYKKNTIVLSDRCTGFAFELENYIIKDGKYPKIDDHLIDCFRYFQTFAHVVLSLAEGDELNDDTDDLYDYILEQMYDETGLPEWIQ